MRDEYVFTTTHHLPFVNPSLNAHQNHERMDLLIVHLSGPMSTPTWAGKTRVLVAVEMGSQLSVGGLLETENDAAGALKTIVMRLEKESGRTSNKIHTDTGNANLHAVSTHSAREITYYTERLVVSFIESHLLSGIKIMAQARDTAPRTHLHIFTYNNA